jgi:hypothetical protein
MNRFSVILPSGKTVNFKSRVEYRWAVAALHPEGNSYWVSNHTTRALADKAARSFTKRNSYDRWQGIVIKVNYEE